MCNGIWSRSVYAARAGQAVGVVFLVVLYVDKRGSADLDDRDAHSEGGCELLWAGHLFLGSVRCAWIANGDCSL